MFYLIYVSKNVEKLQQEITKDIKKEDFELTKFINKVNEENREKLELMKKIDTLERLIGRMRRSQK